MWLFLNVVCKKVLFESNVIDSLKSIHSVQIYVTELILSHDRNNKFILKNLILIAMKMIFFIKYFYC